MHIDTVEVTGSNPVAPTSKINKGIGNNPFSISASIFTKNYIFHLMKNFLRLLPIFLDLVLVCSMPLFLSHSKAS